jgi:hypothetical protein
MEKEPVRKELFSTQIVTKLSNMGWDPGSKRIHVSKRHQIPDPDPQQWTLGKFNFLPLLSRIAVSLQSRVSGTSIYLRIFTCLSLHR